MVKSNKLFNQVIKQRIIMQVILTEQEYITLKTKADNCDSAQKTLATISTQFDELQSKYYKLLTYGVSTNNEKLKTSNDSRLN